jgi:predicted 3-demethylubiquinone-9 3-methyltransferase (glyoxalase superfamily)
MSMPKITPFLWFDTQAEEAAQFYCSIFRNSKILKVDRYPNAGQAVHKKDAGSVMTVEFELDGQRLIALNGGPHYQFSPAVSLFVQCEAQEDVDRYWDKLADGGEPLRCGWIKDKYGFAWQIVPKALGVMLQDKDAARSSRVMQAMMQMIKLDLPALERAYQG